VSLLRGCSVGLTPLVVPGFLGYQDFHGKMRRVPSSDLHAISLACCTTFGQIS
jgi:hypothetical protein